MAEDLPPYLRPLVVESSPPEPVRGDGWALYLPGGDRPAPLVALVHGGPVPADIPVRAAQWPMFRSYAGLLTARGAAAAVVEHPLHSLEDYPRAYDVVRTVVDTARDRPEVDGSQVAVWHFSGSGPMAAQWLSAPPEWLRCLALTYPLLDGFEGWSLPDGFRPVEAVRGGARLPVVLVRVGREAAPLAAAVERFLAAAGGAGLAVEVVDVPNGIHGFDADEPTAESQQAVVESVDYVVRALGAG